MAQDRDWELAGYRLDDEWHDVEKGARWPTDLEWESVDLVTINLDPESDEGFYRSGKVLGGLDPVGSDGFTIYDFVENLAVVSPPPPH